MHKQKHLHYAVIGVLGFALLFMAVGFVAYGHIISNGASAKANLSPIHNIGFSADSYEESDISVPARSKVVTSDSLDFSISLQKPGDSYGSVINIVNNGNVDEMISAIKLEGLPEQLANLVDFRVSYDDKEYVGVSQDIDSLIKTGEENRKQLFVTVTYKNDAQNIGPLDLDLSAKLVFD